MSFSLDIMFDGFTFNSYTIVAKRQVKGIKKRFSFGLFKKQIDLRERIVVLKNHASKLTEK